MPDVETSYTPVYATDRVRLYGGDTRLILGALSDSDAEFGVALTDAPYAYWAYVEETMAAELLDLRADMMWNGALMEFALHWVKPLRTMLRQGAFWLFVEPHYLGTYLRAARLLRWPHVATWQSLRGPEQVEYLLAFSDTWHPSRQDWLEVAWALTQNTYGQKTAAGMLAAIIRRGPAGAAIDPYAGSGTTLEAALLCGRPAVGIELDADRLAECEARLRATGVA